ncbi:unnamed protein product [Bubo scandiacus]
MEQTRGATPADLGVIGGYFLLVLAVGLWSLRRGNRGTISGFFLAGRSMSWGPVSGGALFASNIGSGHSVGLAGTAAAGGIAVGGFGVERDVPGPAAGLGFRPHLPAGGGVDDAAVPGEAVRGGRIRLYLALLSLGLYVATKISVGHL